MVGLSVLTLAFSPSRKAFLGAPSAFSFPRCETRMILILADPKLFKIFFCSYSFIAHL